MKLSSQRINFSDVPLYDGIKEGYCKLIANKKFEN